MKVKYNHRSKTANPTASIKTCLSLCSVALATILSAASVQAKTTNLVQILTFKLTAWSQGPTVTNGNIVSIKANTQSIVTKDIIGWLGMATSNTFTNGQLVVVNQLGVPDSKSVIMVRTTTKISKAQTVTNNVDVSDFFASVTYAATVNNYSYNISNNVVNPGTYYGYWGFYLLDNTNYPSLPVTFQVSGLGVDSAVNVISSKKAVLGLADQFSITNAAGTGTANSNTFILGGNINITGKSLEVTP